ncbi:hypothetical protein ACFO0U_11590 [Chromohalobacter sarecensis]|uniref:Uncharacterized protein n=1 Tax=Chromohalobacter sarecensis TaxID=245294 RepID=A0ABV9D2D4_9GAMM|nr:hypothetical protein [Chromohalobacter sarecensis]MCK0714460.1 hypothetical protein [Chromohalobacter sarecensis]
MKGILVELNPDQIEKAKEINGSGKKITYQWSVVGTDRFLAQKSSAENITPHGM